MGEERFTPVLIIYYLFQAQLREEEHAMVVKWALEALTNDLENLLKAAEAKAAGKPSAVKII